MPTGTDYRQRMLRQAVIAIALLLFVAAGCAGKEAGGDGPGPMATWGNKGFVTLRDFDVEQILEDDAGRIIALGLNEGGSDAAQVVRFNKDGSLDKTFGRDGVVRWPRSDRLGWLMGAILPDGGIALAGSNAFGVIGGGDTSFLVVSKLDEDGRIVRSFGNHGYFVADSGSCLRGPSGITNQGTRILVSVAKFCRSDAHFDAVVIRLRSNGTPDNSFGNAGSVTISRVVEFVYPRIPIIATSQKRLFVAAPGHSGATVEMTALRDDGSRDPLFGHGGIASVPLVADLSGLALSDLFEDRFGNPSLTGRTDAGPFLARFTRRGQPIYFWKEVGGRDTNVESFGGAFGGFFFFFARFEQLANGDFAVAGTVLARIKPWGVIDPHYPVLPLIARGPFAGALAWDLLAARDGTLLVALSKYRRLEGKHTTIIARYRQPATTT